MIRGSSKCWRRMAKGVSQKMTIADEGGRGGLEMSKFGWHNMWTASNLLPKTNGDTKENWGFYIERSLELLRGRGEVMKKKINRRCRLKWIASLWQSNCLYPVDWRLESPGLKPGAALCICNSLFGISPVLPQGKVLDAGKIQFSFSKIQKYRN